MVPDKLFRQRARNNAKGLFSRQFLVCEEAEVEQTLRICHDHVRPQLIQRDFYLFMILWRVFFYQIQGSGAKNAKRQKSKFDVI